MLEEGKPNCFLVGFIILKGWIHQSRNWLMEQQVHVQWADWCEFFRGLVYQSNMFMV